MKTGSKNLVNTKGAMRKNGTSKFKKAMTMMEDEDSFIDKGTANTDCEARISMSSKEIMVKSGLKMRVDPP